MAGPVESAGVWKVELVEDIRALPTEASVVLVVALDDEKLRALAGHRGLRTIFSDGNSRTTDEGVRALAALPELEQLDLEWSESGTDAALAALRAAPKLEGIDLTGCLGISPAAIAAFRAARPEVEIEPTAV